MPQLPAELLNTISEVLVWIVVIATATMVSLWVGLAMWTLRDMRDRTRDPFAWLLATLLVLATGPLGLLLYYLMRPRETLAEAYDRQLEEEALLRDITTRRACPRCQTVTEPEWLICPHCGTQLRRTCEHCSRPLELDWVACPYCTQPVPDARPEPVRRITGGDGGTTTYRPADRYPAYSAPPLSEDDLPGLPQDAYES